MLKDFFYRWKKYKLRVSAVILLLVSGVLYGVMEYMDAQIKPVVVKTPEKKKKKSTSRKDSGCQSAKYFVNLNVLLHDIDNPEQLLALMDDLRFENGKVVYPEADDNQKVLEAVKAFLGKMTITTAEELEQCVEFVRPAHNYNKNLAVMFISSNVTK